MKSILVDKANQYLKDHRKRKIFFGVVAVLSAVTIFGVNRFLTRPAISMEKQNIVMSASPSDAEMGDTITVTVSALAESSQKYTSFLILSESTGAGLTDDYTFDDDNVAEIETDNDKVLKLHRFLDENGKVDYYFTLKKNETVTFTLDCISDAVVNDLQATGSDAVSDSLEKTLMSLATSSNAGSDLLSDELDGMETATSSDLIEEVDAADKIIRITSDPVSNASGADAETKVAIVGDDDEEDNALPNGEVFGSTPSTLTSGNGIDSVSSAVASENSTETIKEIGQTLDLYYGSGKTLKEAYKAIRSNLNNFISANTDNAQATCSNGKESKDNREDKLKLSWLIVDSLQKQTLTATIYIDNTLSETEENGAVITASGMLPVGSTVKAYPKTIEKPVPGKMVLASYDITVFMKNGEIFEPAEGNPIFVEIKLPVLADPSKTLPKNISVYHVADDGSTAETVDSNIQNGGINFEASHFSTYQILSSDIVSVIVSKSWSDGTSSHTNDSVAVKLFSHTKANETDINDLYATYVQTIPLNSVNNWTTTITDLPTRDTSGNYISYSAIEDSFSGYTPSYNVTNSTTDDTNTTFIVITNSLFSVPSTANVQLQHTKTIDFLGDGVANTDTDETTAAMKNKSDLYRLYLDISGKQKPSDFLFVIDRSGSMQKSDISGSRRDYAIMELLDGKNYLSKQVSDDGLMRKILALNNKNKIAVTSFYGDMNVSSYSTRGYTYSKDSSNLLDWTSTASYVDATRKYNNGTNYEAGLFQANLLLAKVSGNNDDGNDKVLIFISDGVPTLFIDDNGNRKGNGSYENAKNVDLCKQPSKDAFDTLIKNSYPSVRVFSVGVSSDINGTSLSESTSPEVLKYMSGEDNYFSVTDSDSLNNAFTEILNGAKASSVSVTDILSQYVNWYGAQPDVKVTRTKLVNGEPSTNATDTTVLWSGTGTGTSGVIGSATTDNYDNGTQIIQSVSYIPDASGAADTTGTVTVEFNPNFSMTNEYIYTLSFNVQVSEKAYAEYTENKTITDNNGYGTIKGDQSTDYGKNTTSSNKPGFHSNKSATVDYVVKSSHYEDTYAHPVIQVVPVDLKLVKKGLESTKPALSGAVFELYEATDDWQKKDGTSAIQTGTSSADGTLSFSSLAAGKYLLYETKAVAGYQLPKAPWKITVGTDTSISIWDSNGSSVSADTQNVFPIYNSLAFDLPNTGSTGTTRYTMLGILLMAMAGVMYRKKYIMNERRQKGNSRLRSPNQQDDIV